MTISVELCTLDAKTKYAVSDLYSLTDNVAFSQEQFDSYLDSGKPILVWIAKKNNLIIGTLVVVKSEPFLEHIILLKVHPHYDQEIEDQLISAYFEIVKKSTKVIAFCRELPYDANRTAFLVSYGFEIVGEQVIEGNNVIKYRKKIK